MGSERHTRTVLDLCDRALELEAEERASFLDRACGDSPQVRESVEAVLRAITATANFVGVGPDDPSLRASLVGQQIGSYRILEQLGQGGMGEVFLAEREHQNYRQRVAFKVLRGRLFTREMARQFDAERKILAGLSHPYIAALIDGGTTPDGRPYLVMEHVEGRPLDDYCDEHALSIDERIALLQKVALAVHCAHQNLVVHRDLKPSNVLVTADGIPKLLDFGIAKPLQSDTDPAGGQTTLLGAQALTPDFASPEQILENKTTTASDVYSLGVLAYVVLAGAQPYTISSASALDLLNSVQQLERIPPSVKLARIDDPDRLRRITANRQTTLAGLRKRLSGDLDNIVMKALSREPERRYESVDAFHSDLSRFLEMLPVAAQPDTAAYRVQRFVARNRLLVHSAIALLVTILGSLAMVSFAYVRAESERDKARVARDEATQRFEQVRSIAHTMMFDVFDEVTELEGSLAAREKLAASAQTYLDSLAQSESASPDVRFYAAQGFERLGRVRGGVDGSTLGQRSQASENFATARSILVELVSEYPDNSEYALALGQLQRDQSGQTLYSQNDTALSEKFAKESIATFAAIPERTEAVVLGQVSALAELADTYDWKGEHKQCVEVLREALAILQGEQLDPLLNPTLGMTHARVLRELGNAEYYLDEMESSLRHIQEALAIERRAASVIGNHADYQRALATTLFSLAGVQIDAGHGEDSVATIDEAAEVARRMLRANPDDVGAMQTYASIAEQRATILSVLERHEEAIEQSFESYDITRSLAEISDGDAMHRRDMIIGQFNLGRVHYSAGFNEDACSWLTQAVDALNELHAQGRITGFDRDTLLPEIVAFQERACP